MQLASRETFATLESTIKPEMEVDESSSSDPREIPDGTVVISVGSKPDTLLEQSLNELGPPPATGVPNMSLPGLIKLAPGAHIGAVTLGTSRLGFNDAEFVKR